MQCLTTFNRDKTSFRHFAVWLAVVIAVNTGIRPLLLAAIWYSVDERDGPPLKLEFVAFG
jgi:hypothetical protein